MKNSGRVGTYLNAGADLAQFGGLFKHPNVKPGTPKCQRGSEAADPGSDYYDSHVREHIPLARITGLRSSEGSLSYLESLGR